MSERPELNSDLDVSEGWVSCSIRRAIYFYK